MGLAVPRSVLNVLDEGLCEAGRTELPSCIVFVFFVDLLAEGVGAFDALLFADLFRPPAGDPTGDLEDFLRVFLDIRLPFVAFPRLHHCAIEADWNQSRSWAGRTSQNYAQRKSETLPICSVKAVLGGR
jgi:hypothetical protein